MSNVNEVKKRAAYFKQRVKEVRYRPNRFEALNLSAENGTLDLISLEKGFYHY
jgi:hypothetical protein